jgi:hypothetical protein
MYKKIYIAVDCENEQEQQLVQNIAQDISQSFTIKAKDLIGFYPAIQKNKALLNTIVKTVSREGKKGLMKLIPILIKQL